MPAPLQQRQMPASLRRGLVAWLFGALCATSGLAQEKPIAVEHPWANFTAQAFSRDYRENARRISALQSELSALAAQPIGQQSERIGWHSNFSATANVTKWLQVELDRAQSFDAVVIVPVDVPYGAYAGPGYGFPVRFRVETSDDSAFSAPRLLAALDDKDFPNPGDAPVFLPTPNAKGKFVRVTATRLWQRGDLALLALGEVFVLNRGNNLATLRPVSVSDSYQNPPAWQSSNATDGQSALGPPVQPAPSPANGWHSLIEHSPDLIKWVQVDLGKEMPLDEVRIFPARPRDFPARSGFGFPPRFKVEAAAGASFSQPQMLLDQTAGDFINPAENPVIIPAHGVRARFVRMTATRLWNRSNDYIFALAELQAYSGGENAALHSAVTSLDSIEHGSWSAKYLVDGFNSQRKLAEPADWLRGLSRRREANLEIGTLELRQGKIIAAIGREAVVGLILLAVLLCAAAGLSVHRAKRARRREVERLRERIASDLHDEIGSNLGCIALLSEMALKEPGEAQTDLLEINRVARETAASMRDIVWLIKLESNHAEDLIAKLRETAAMMLAGIAWSFECDPLSAALSLDCKRQLLLIFKEALHNIRRHAGARHVAIHIFQREGLTLLKIEDDGAGFDPGVASHGNGLSNLRQRAASLGGELAIHSSPGQGCKIELSLKLNPRLLAVS